MDVHELLGAELKQKNQCSSVISISIRDVIERVPGWKLSPTTDHGTLSRKPGAKNQMDAFNTLLVGSRRAASASRLH